MGNPRDTCIFDVVIIGGIEQHSAERISRLHRATDHADAPFSLQPLDIARHLCRDDGQMRFGLEKQPQLGQRSLATTRDNDPAAFDCHEYRKMLHHSLQKSWLGYRILFWNMAVEWGR